MRLNRKDKAKSQGDDETKIYDGYIRLNGFSTAAISLVPPLRVSSNWIAATKMPRANRLQLAPIFFPSLPLLFIRSITCLHALNGFKLIKVKKTLKYY